MSVFTTYTDQFSIAKNGKMNRLVFGATSLVFWCHVSSFTQLFLTFFVQRFCYNTFPSIHFILPHTHRLASALSIIIIIKCTEREWVSFIFVFLFAFETSHSISVVWLVSVSFLMISRYLQLSAGCCFFLFLYEMWCARVKLHSAHDIVWYILYRVSVCWMFKLNSISFRFDFFLYFLLNFLSYGIVLLFARVSSHRIRNTFQVWVVSISVQNEISFSVFVLNPFCFWASGANQYHRDNITIN